MEKEPAVIVSTVAAFLVAVIGLGVAFGLDITPEQRDAMIAVIAPTAAMIFLSGPIIRQYVFSPASAQRVADEAYEAGATGQPPPRAVSPPGT